MLLLSSPSNCISAHDSRAGRGGKSSAASWLCCRQPVSTAVPSLCQPPEMCLPNRACTGRGTWASAPSKTGLQAKMICRKHQGEVFFPHPLHKNTSCLWDGIWKWKCKSAPRSGFARAAKSQPLPAFLQGITAVPTAW